MAKKPRTCSVENCNGKHRGRGLCVKHHTRFLRYGTTEKRGPRKIRFDGKVAYIPLTMGFEAVIDADDAGLVDQWNWSATQSGRSVYAVRSARTNNGGSTDIRLHRVIANAADGFEVDHINGDGLDNRRENLRQVTKHQNQHNARRRADNTSGFKGVCWHKGDGMWHANIQAHGKRIHLGHFDTPELAHQAYCDASIKYHGKYGRTD